MARHCPHVYGVPNMRVSPRLLYRRDLAGWLKVAEDCFAFQRGAGWWEAHHFSAHRLVSHTAVSRLLICIPPGADEDEDFGYSLGGAGGGKKGKGGKKAKGAAKTAEAEGTQDRKITHSLDMLGAFQTLKVGGLQHMKHFWVHTAGVLQGLSVSARTPCTCYGPADPQHLVAASTDCTAWTARGLPNPCRSPS